MRDFFLQFFFEKAIITYISNLMEGFDEAHAILRHFLVAAHALAACPCLCSGYRFFRADEGLGSGDGGSHW